MKTNFKHAAIQYLAATVVLPLYQDKTSIIIDYPQFYTHTHILRYFDRWEIGSLLFTNF